MSDEEKWKSSIDTGTYKETIFSKWMTLLLGSITTIFLLIWAYDLLVGLSWSDPLSRWFWPGMFLLFLLITGNFSRLKIKITSDGLSVGYGITRKKVPWERIENCHVDESSAIRYGGYGIRFTRVGGKWRTGYNVIGTPRVVISLNEGFVREIAFSTKNPDEVMEVIKSHLRKRGRDISDK